LWVVLELQEFHVFLEAVEEDRWHRILTFCSIDTLYIYKYPHRANITHMLDTKQVLQEKFPFLTIIRHLDSEYLGIVQNADQTVLHLYVMDNTFNDEMKREFLACGDVWWWESNRQIPINMFIRERFSIFKRYLRIFSMKETEVVQGPVVNLRDLMNKRVKRRTIQLVRQG
jgi:hypothetical protein